MYVREFHEIWGFRIFNGYSLPLFFLKELKHFTIFIF